MPESCCEGWVCTLDAGQPVEIPDRDASVLAELAREPDGRVAFQGLRRSLGLHQQVLTRALRRLERDGLVARDAHGYRLTEQGFAVVCRRGEDAPAVARAPAPTLTVVQAVLPPHVATKDLADRLAGRWFRGLRWYGRTDGPGESTLAWTDLDRGSRVVVRLSGGSVAVDVEMPDGADAAHLAAVRGIVAALADVYAAPTRPSAGDVPVEAGSAA